MTIMKRTLLAALLAPVLSAFADTPTITDVTARQRYPWNGLVDVDVAFGGPSGERYRIELSARDEAGGTNLPVRTAWLEGAPGAVGNPVDVPAPGAHRLVWNAEADFPQGFVSENVTISAKLLDPVWSFESIPAIDPNDEWAPETVYHDVQTVVSYGEIEDRTPAIRCLTDEWNLADKLGANVVFSGASMGLRKADDMMRRRGVEHPLVLWAYSGATNVLRMVTLDYETGAVSYDLASLFLSSTDIRFFSMRGGAGRAYADLCRNGYDTVFKSANTDFSSVGIHCRYGDEMHGSAVCGYLPNGIPWSDASSTSTSSYNKATNAAVFLCGTTGTDLKQAIVGLSGGVPATSKYSCMKNPTGRYVVPLLDANTYFTAGCGTWDENAVQTHRVFMGDFSDLGGEIFDLRPTELGSDWIREPEVAYSKAVAMPDGVRFFFGGAGRDADGTVKMWCGNSDQYAGGGIQDDPEGLEPGMRKRVYGKYPAGHPFESWARRDVTCLLPNGKFCGVDEELGLVVVNPLTGETYVASDDPAFKKGKMGCQLLPNGKVWIVPYDCEGREYLAGTKLCGKLYEVDFGFTRSFSLSSLLSPYLRVAEGDPEPSGVKVGLDPNGGELPGVFAQYYKGESPVYGELPVPTRSDYTFLGWSTDGTAANIIAATDSVPQGGIKLKAVWKPIDLYLVIDLSGGTSATSYPVSSLSDVPEGGWTDEYKTTKLVLRRCKAGTFKMGNNYTTTLTKDFFIGVFEVTQKQYVLVTGSNPVLSSESILYGDTKPVCKLDHTRIRGSDFSEISESSFMGRLRTKSGIAFDLPTEAQWEYACRAGTTSAYNNGGDLESDLAQVGRYHGNAVVGNSLTTAVPGQYAPNAWGLYDMHGNVQEVVLDRGGPLVDGAIDPLNLSTSSSFDHIKRGGDYTSYADKCTSSYRRYLPGSGSTGNSTVQDSGIRLCVTCE